MPSLFPPKKGNKNKKKPTKQANKQTKNENKLLKRGKSMDLNLGRN